MKKIILEALLSVAFVFVGTFFAYGRLSGIASFWDAQFLWSIALGACWIIVAAGYFHQGWLIRTLRSSHGVSLILPVAVFFVQCILFVKGVFYNDLSLIFGAVVVNSAVTFSVFNIVRFRRSGVIH